MTKPFPLRVLGARLIVKMDEVEKKTLGGLYIPGMENEESKTGEVVAVGEGQRLDNGTFFPMSVKVGDQVLIQDNAGVPVSIPNDSSKYLVINEAHIMAVSEA